METFKQFLLESEYSPEEVVEIMAPVLKEIFVRGGGRPPRFSTKNINNDFGPVVHFRIKSKPDPSLDLMKGIDSVFPGLKKEEDSGDMYGFTTKSALYTGSGREIKISATQQTRNENPMEMLNITFSRHKDGKVLEWIQNNAKI